MKTPVVEHIYRNHHIDSSIWDFYKPRKDDIIISSGFKSGTTWMQMIVSCLLFQEEKSQPPLQSLSPWVEMVWNPEATLKKIEAQTHRRFLKTHLPADGLPYFPDVKYIILARDIRDVFMSLWNHYRNYTEMIYGRLKTLPRCPDDIHDFWRIWISRGWFNWQSEGYPFWGVMYHADSWWRFRGLPNIMLVHYNDLLLDLAAGIQKVAAFLDIDAPDGLINNAVIASSFRQMKKNHDKIWKNADKTWKNGGDTFFLAVSITAGGPFFQKKKLSNTKKRPGG
jgi:aryl sulfotransferase